MRTLILLLVLPLYLAAFETRPVLPQAVVGFTQVPLDDRSISLWYPVDPKTEAKSKENPWDLFLAAKGAAPLAKNPLIIVSHGYLGDPYNLSWLIRGLVDSGFTVAAVKHRDKINDRMHLNHWLRAVDVKEMIDSLEHSSAAGSIDFSRIGFAGFSLGGTTGIFLAGGRAENLDNIIPGKEYANPQDFNRAKEALPTLKREEMKKDYREPRIRAFFLMAPASAWIFSDASLRGIANPVYLIGGAADEFLVTEANAGHLAKMIPTSYYQTIPGKTGHFAFLTSKRQNDRKPTSDPRFTDDPSVDRDWIQSKTLSEAIRFFKETLR